MHFDDSLVAVAGRLMIVFLFLVTGMYDMRRDEIRRHVEIIAALHVPNPLAAFWSATAMKFGGCALLLACWHAEWGVYLLMLFIVVALAIYLRFWTLEDPMRRSMNWLLLLNSVGILGRLLLVLRTFE